eukprot:TRINITY_DN2685_c0_g1_i4.p1 TRINITY_DN2685_c0_g1~~TRINITY_DN2685_c0_g1_i4.p1  ORF type:complete len:261 (-),score=49.35 TRINITY_DN2685_c0_g1_i4:286-1068(-)
MKRPREDELDEFTAWLRGNAAWSDPLRFDFLGDTIGFGASICHDLPAGGQMCSLPASLLLGPTAARSHPEIGAALSQLGMESLPSGSSPQLLERTLTQICLLWEARVGAHRSPWRKYIALLPSRFDSALSWPQEEVSHRLAGTPLCQGALRIQQERERVFECAVRGTLSAEHPDLFPPEEFDPAGMAWAHAAFWSRALQVPGLGRMGSDEATEHLVPLVDIMNHRPGALTRFEHSTGTIRVISDATLAAGSPAEINYGEE